MANIIVLIPARLASTRLPNKPLADINGKPLIQHVYEHVLKVVKCPVYVTAGNQEIVSAIERCGGQAILTDPNLPSGSDRIAAALKMLDPSNKKYDVVVSFQGDAVNTNPEIVNDLVALLEKSGADITTPAQIMNPASYNDASCVKIAMGIQPGENSGRALYFSRAQIPFDRDGPQQDLYHHVGLYVYRAQALQRFVAGPQGILERREKLEQLRALELGMNIWALLIKQLKLIPEAPADVDTPEELEAIRKVMF